MKQRILTFFVLLVLGIANASAQSKTITGKVTGADDGLTLPGVSIRVQNTSIGTQTNADGVFTLNVPANAKALIFSYLGYANQTVAIGSQTVINVKLTPDSKALSEVVVVGYQSIQRKDVVGALSAVDGKELEAKPIASFAQRLQGTAAGLQVTGSSGRPGSNAYIRVRGVGSITASAEPLIVVDGIQISTSAYNGLNPDDIENVSILKDASATAIYGSRGANGVILVTTKTGKPNTPVLNYSFRFGKTQAQPLKNVTLMNSAEKLQLEYEYGQTNATLDSMITNRGYPAGTKITTLTPSQRQGLWDLAIARGAGDWTKYLLQTATMRTHELSLSGGDGKVTYYLSGNINDNPGVERFSEFNRKGGRLNVTYQAKDWFKIGTNIGVTASHDTRVREAYNSQNSWGAVFFFNPYEQPYNNDGSYNTTLSQGFSPLEGATNNPVSYDWINQFGTFYGEASFFKKLTLKSTYAINYNTLKYQSYLEPGSNLAGILGYNQKQDQNQNDFFYSITNTANWRQTVGKHSFNALIGNEYDKDNLYTANEIARGFPSKAQTTLDNAATPTTASTSLSEFSLISYFGSLSYDFDKRYFITASGRRDGSSRFGANVKFANFGAIGLAWDLKNEKFWTLPAVISDLKLRASYGTTGNNTIPEYQALGTYSLVNKYNDQLAATPLKLDNPELTWETSYAKDAGLTYGLFDSRITGEFDYYSRENKNLLYSINVSQTTGFSTYTGNVGAVKNSGVEFGITGAVVRTKDLKWNVSFNYSHNNNTVTQLFSDNVIPPTGYGISKLIVGQPLNVYYLVQTKGVDPADGKLVYYNLDGTTTKTYNPGQAAVLNGKSPNVKYFGTIGTDVSYKGFDLDVRLYYSGGNYIYNLIEADATTATGGAVLGENQYTEAFNYWKKPGDIAEYPNPLDPTQTEHTSDKYLQKGDYISLRDVTLGYSLNKKYTKHLGIAGLRVFAQGTNLALWTKFHGLPEIGDSSTERAPGSTTVDYPGIVNRYGYPSIKGYTFGVDIRF